MKKVFLKSMLLLCALIAGSSSVWADSYTITFGNNASSATGISSSTNATTVISNGTTYVTTQPFTINSGNCYYGDTQSCIRIGKSGNSSSLSIALSDNGKVTATSIVVNCNNTGGKNNSDAGLNVNSIGEQTTSETADNYTFTYTNATDITSITLEGTASIRIYSITVNYTSAVAISSIAFSAPKTASVVVGGTTNLSPTVLPANHTEVVDWESDDTDVATVSSTGVVTGVAAGTAHIKAKAHNSPSLIYDVCTVTVNTVAVTGVSLKASTTIEKDKTETLTPTFTPSNATNKAVSWESDDTSVATVSAAGVVTGVKAGTANITVTTDDGGKTATCVVTVVNAKGTIDYPYSVSDVIALNPTSTSSALKSDVYVKGFIVGSCNTSTGAIISDPTKVGNTNLALVDDPDDLSSNLCIQLPSGTIRTNFNVLDKPQFMNVIQVILQGDIFKYCGIPGVKNTDYMVMTAARANVSAAGWASAFFDFKVEVPEGLTAYYASAATNASVTLTEVGGNKVLPASFGVVVSGAEGAYDFECSSADPAVDKAEVTNKLSGVVNTTTTVASITPGSGNSLYVLGKEGGNVGFYLPGTGLTKLSAYKAYLIAPSQPTSAPGIQFIIENENNATEIEAIDANEDAIKFIENGKLLIKRDGVVYDALGRVIR